MLSIRYQLSHEKLLEKSILRHRLETRAREAGAVELRHARLML
jgi:hypothetical protein